MKTKFWRGHFLTRSASALQTARAQLLTGVGDVILTQCSSSWDVRDQERSRRRAVEGCGLPRRFAHLRSWYYCDCRAVAPDVVAAGGRWRRQRGWPRPQAQPPVRLSRVAALCQAPGSGTSRLRRRTGPWWRCWGLTSLCWAECRQPWCGSGQPGAPCGAWGWTRLSGERTGSSETLRGANSSGFSKALSLASFVFFAALAPTYTCLILSHLLPLYPPWGFGTAVLRAFQLFPLLYVHPRPAHLAGASSNILSRSQWAKAPHFSQEKLCPVKAITSLLLSAQQSRDLSTYCWGRWVRREILKRDP